MPVINIREQKKILRAKHKKLRAECPADIKKSLDERLFQKFCSLQEYKDCETLFAFASTAIEVDTGRIIEAALSDGKRLALPRCRAGQPLMDFYYVTSLSALEKGAYSLMEPNPALCERVEDYSHGLCLVPGLCFDLSGYRVGFGKGYYDRFLQDFSGVTAGLCYQRNIEQKIPAGIFDKPVDILITEKFINDARSVFKKGMV